jgi:hypothetical protein
VCGKQPVRPVPPAMLDNRPWWRPPVAPPCAWRPVPRVLPPGREYFLVRREAVVLGVCEPQPTDPRRTRCVRGLAVCGRHTDCRASLALSLRCAS